MSHQTKTSQNKINQNKTSQTEPIDMAIQAMEALKQEQALRQSAEAALEAQRGKVLFADAVSAGSDSILVGEMATILKQSGVEIGQERLFAWLRSNGYVLRQPCGHNQPTQKSLELGIMELKYTALVNASGKVRVTRTPKITPKGQLYFFEKVTAQKDEINAMKKKPQTKK